MRARTLVLPTAVGIALMACGGVGETTAPGSSPAQPVPAVPVSYPSVEITPRAATVVRGARLSFYLTLKGFTADVDPRASTWTSSNSTVVEVSRVSVNGQSSSSIPVAVAYAAGVGSATVMVWVGGRSASVVVTVTEAAANNP